MEELIAKWLVQAGPIGAVLVIIYLVHELSRIQKFVEDEFAEANETIASQGAQINLLVTQGAVHEERLKSLRGGKSGRRGGSND